MQNLQEAEMIAINALQYLAGDEEQLGRFLALTGMEIQDFRNNAASNEFQAALLEFLLGNEPTLLAFCAQFSIDPQNVSAAHLVLSGPPYAGPGDFAP